MAGVTRKRTIGAPVGEVWRLVSDPYALPRWWPRVSRVENVERRDGGRRSHWTKVLETAEGRGVRADYRCLSSAENERYVWEQMLAGTPFARHLSSSRVEIRLREAEGGTEVSIAFDQTMRGLSRLGSPLLRRGQKEILETALDGIERSVSSSSPHRAHKST